MKLRYIILSLLTFVISLPALAVTDKEMDHAKAIAAKLYLRWANNGSGYLDEFSVSSMAELESKLKAKEKENLKVFKSVAIPADYSSWNKTKLVEFWGTTFFTSPALNPDGKKAKDRVRKQIEALSISAPQAKAEEPAKQPESTPAVSETPSETNASAPSAETAVEEQEQLLADQNAIAEDLEQARNSSPKSQNNTWIYVVILVVLVGLVIWLMVYAANMMKRQGAEAKALASTSPEDKERIKRLQNEIERLNSQLTESRANEKKLKEEVSVLNSRLVAATEAAKAAQLSGSAPKPEPKPEPKIPSEIFLGRANAKGQFVRGDRRPVPGHTIFSLETKDGNVGTFRFAGTPDAIELALSNPFQFLVGGCNSDNFEDAETATRIITETPGTAIFENNCWKVLRKSRIRFE